MIDPRVVALEFVLKTDDSMRFENPPALEADAPQFGIRLANDVLTLKMKEHYATQEEAIAAAQPYLRAWELDYALENGRRAFRFEFFRAEVIDRSPRPGQLDPITVKATAVVGLTDNLAMTVIRHHYPEAPPHNFTATPDVQSLWDRYERAATHEREPLPAMGYFCLTVVEAIYGEKQRGTPPRKRRARSKAVRALNVEDAVLDMLGTLTSERGDALSARKQEERGQLFVALTHKEEEWVKKALREVLRRMGLSDAARATLPPLTMTDLPPL